MKLPHIAFEELVFTVLLLERYVYCGSKFGTFLVLGAILACLRTNFKFGVHCIDQQRTINVRLHSEIIIICVTTDMDLTPPPAETFHEIIALFWKHASF